MTDVKIHPLWSYDIHPPNLIKFAKESGFTVLKYVSRLIEEDGTSYLLISLAEILTAGQQTAIRNLFSGTAYIEFS